MTKFETYQLVIQVVGIIGLLLTLLVYYLQFRKMNEANRMTREAHRIQLEQLQRSMERETYISLIDTILDLKHWSIEQPYLMEGVRDDGLVKDLVKKGIVKDEKELMSKCIFFFRMEKLYQLARTGGISQERRNGLDREVLMWVGLPASRLFFSEFCLKARCYSNEFLEWVQASYAAEGTRSELANPPLQSTCSAGG